MAYGFSLGIMGNYGVNRSSKLKIGSTFSITGSRQFHRGSTMQYVLITTWGAPFKFFPPMANL